VLDFNSAMLTTDARKTGDKDALTFCGGGAINATDKSNYPTFMRVAFRSSLRADYTTNNLGFRCAADDKEPKP
jgi:formylglycine-generating enzyme required for sulfatase activity